MKIKTLTFTNCQTGWNIKDVHFNNTLTLLVGASGVGKTQILHVLDTLSRIARGYSFNGIEWNITFEHDMKEYCWMGAFQMIPINDDEIEFTDESLIEEKNRKNYPILKERLSINGDVIIDRDSEDIIFEGQKTVKLDNTKSAIYLLKGEHAIFYIYSWFSQIYFLETDEFNRYIYPFDYTVNPDSVKQIVYYKFYSPLEKLFLSHKGKLEEYDMILQKFQDIFPLVDEIGFDYKRSTIKKDALSPVLKIKEKGVDSWIFQKDISSGMLRALMQITALVFAQDGDVILIDEFENGLGVNCINQLADLVTDPEADVQIIMTSHHPYIINAIPVKWWKIVTRNGSEVKTHSAEEFNIGEHSKHEAFMQLMQNQAYRTGQV